MHTLMITLPDGTVAASSEHSPVDRPWAIVVSSMTPIEVRVEDENRIDAAHHEISTLTAALARMVVTFEMLSLPTEIEPRPIFRASLDGSDIFVLTDSAHNVQDVTAESVTGLTFPFFVSLGLTHEEGLAAAVAARISTLEKSISECLLSLTGASSQPDPRLSTRILRWDRDEETARKLASRIRASVTVVRINPADVIPLRE